MVKSEFKKNSTKYSFFDYSYSNIKHKILKYGVFVILFALFLEKLKKLIISSLYHSYTKYFTILKMLVKLVK
jgi:hypothetical protein